MPRKRKLTNLSNRCRFCLTSDACSSQLFDDWIRPKIENLEKCTLIEILDRPNYPKKICYICLYKLEMWNGFKDQFLKTNQTLINHFNITDPQVNETDKIVDIESTGDDLFLETDVKRPRIAIEETINIRSSLESRIGSSMKSPLLSPTKASILKAADPNIEAVIINETEKKIITVNKSHTSDSSSSPVRKISRAKRVEREALTKRWEERKNALLAATGEPISETDSENGTQLSPVQKARAKMNSSSEKDEQKSKKIQRALKNLETNLTQKYMVSLENTITEEERKTRSRRGNAEGQLKEIKLSKSSKIEKPKIDIKKEPVTEKILGTHPSKKGENKEKENFGDKQQTVDSKTTILGENPSVVYIGEDQLEQSKEDEDVEIIDVDDDTSNVNPSRDPNDHDFTPQLVTSEVSLGNATYVVTTTLEVPNTLLTKSDISLKTNGINIDASAQDGSKIDLLNAVHLQRSATKNESASKEVDKNGLGSTVEKCLKIEIEGMEVAALQRVQLELAKFVEEDVQKRLLVESSKKSDDPKNLNFKDTYESLDYQLKNIIEKVLRSDYHTDHNKTETPSTPKEISPECIKEAANSPVFQPEVKICKLNLGKLCKTYNINNLHILEDVKRQRKVAGPLSKTLGKRTLKLPKRYDDFDITLPANEAVRTATPTPKPTPAKPLIEVVSETIESDVDEPMLEDELEDEDESMLEEVAIELNESVENNRSTSSIVDLALSAEEVEKEEKKNEETHKKKLVKNAAEQKVKDTAITSLQPVLSTIKSGQSHVETILLVPPTPPTNAQVKPSTPKGKPLPSLVNRQPTANTNNKLSLKQILPSPTKNKPKPVTKANNTSGKMVVKRQRHICGICGKELFSKEDAEAHVKSHKTDTLSSSLKPSKQILPKIAGPTPTIVTTTSVTKSATPEPQTQVQAPPQQVKPKPKLMRCKRCQAIVEAKEVRSHVCNSVKFNCTLCECSFGAEHLLLEHIETHARNNKIVKKTDVKSQQKPLATIKNKSTKESHQHVIVISDHNEAVMVEQEENQQSYSCFVCDKIFLEEDQMKEHLQMHCEEVANDSDADGHQCAFCGEKFQSEEILEAHVGNHLKDDGDEKINMIISMETRRAAKPKKPISQTIRCEQCSETFSSSLQLAMHLPIHEEEHMVVEEEPAEEEEEDEHYVCNVCDEIFDSPDELAEHLNTEHNGNTHMCILCETSFSSVRELQEHVSTHL